MITQKRLKEVLKYDQHTGEFISLVNRGSRVKAGESLGSLNLGYLVISIDKKSYKSHRLAFLYMTGRFPENQTDHIDQDRKNNKFINLREVTPKQNSRNKKRQESNISGFCGVGFRKDNNLWRARIYSGDRNITIGHFESLSDAVLARLNAEVEYGYHQNHGNDCIIN
jgi:hypothetical protein